MYMNHRCIMTNQRFAAKWHQGLAGSVPPGGTSFPMRTKSLAAAHLGGAQHAVAIDICLSEKILGMVQHVRLVDCGCVAQGKDAATAAVHHQMLIYMNCVAVLLQGSGLALAKVVQEFEVHGIKWRYPTLADLLSIRHGPCDRSGQRVHLDPSCPERRARCQLLQV
jgi:hypothetical protein